MDDLIALAPLQRRRLRRYRRIGDGKLGQHQRRDPGGDPLGTQEQMKMPMLGTGR